MARRKITEPLNGLDASELPELTPSQLAFVESLLAGRPAAEAYRAAYDARNMSNNAVWVEASRLKALPKIALWLDAARSAGFGRVSCTLDEHMTELARLRGASERAGNYGAAVQAEQLRGKVAGHYVDQVKDITPISPADTLRDIASHSPELAASLAAQHGIEWGKPETETAH